MVKKILVKNFGKKKFLVKKNKLKKIFGRLLCHLWGVCERGGSCAGEAAKGEATAAAANESAERESDGGSQGQGRWWGSVSIQQPEIGGQEIGQVE